MRKILFIVLVLFLYVNFTSAAVTMTDSVEANASICINESKLILQEMVDDGLNILRINDSLKQAESLYSSQKILKEKRRSYDFSIVLGYCNEIKTIREDSIVALDEFRALKQLYDASKIDGMNMTVIDSRINEIQVEIDNERYENVKGLVDKAYQDLINLRESYSRLNVLYENTTRSVQKFILDRWKILLALFVLVVALFTIYRIRIIQWILNRKLEKLTIRKKTLKNLTKDIQRKYFQDGTISEGEFNIKTNKFGELIRDIDRQVPLLQEQLAKLGGTGWKIKT